MKFSIIYGTNSGSTKTVAEIIQQTLETKGHTVNLINAAQAEAGDFQASDVTIIGSCTWELVEKGQERLEGQLQQHWLQLIKRLKGQKFTGQRFAVFGLGDSTFQHFCAAASHLEELVKTVGGSQVGSTLRIDSFYFDTANQKRVRDWVGEIVRTLTRGV